MEGVVLADKVEALFRNVPPALSLALAMTEKHEKAERAAIMRENNCPELEAVLRDRVSKSLVRSSFTDLRVFRLHGRPDRLRIPKIDCRRFVPFWAVLVPSYRHTLGTVLTLGRR